MDTDTIKLQILLSADFSTILYLCKTNEEFKEVCKKNKDIIRDYILTTHPETSANVDLLLNGPSPSYYFPVKTSDNQELAIPGTILEISTVLKDMFILGRTSEASGSEASGSERSTVKIPFNSKILNIIITLDNPAKYDLDTLLEVAKAANYLEIESYLDSVSTQIAKLIHKI
jgi:hypothetical protein